jgi:multidrug efflux pump subunit AcrA (membrane-fusion protein)
VNDHKENSYAAPASPAAAPEARPPASLSERVRSLRLKEQPRKPARKTPWLPWSLCVVLAAATGYLAYVAYVAPRADGSQPEPGQNASGGTLASRTPASVASSGDVVLERKGYIIPAHQILLSPKVSGVILEMFIKDKDGNYKLDNQGRKIPLMEGIRVEKDDILACLETVDYQTDHDRMAATVALNRQHLLELERGNRPEEIQQAKAELEEMEANLKQLELDYKRSARLRTTTALAAKDYELAEGQYLAMEKRVKKLRQAYRLMVIGPRIERIDACRAELKQSEADLAKAKWRLDNCTVRAPISGTILTKKAELGNLVNPIAFAGSQQLCEMADLSDIEVDMSIEERDVSKVFAGQRCKVRAEAYPERVYDGVVSRLMPTADRAKSAIPVRVKLSVPKEEEGVYLKPEMGAVVAFLKKTDK